MARKRGRNADTELEATKALEEKLKTHKTHQEIAEEEGVHQTTISRRIAKAMASERVQDVITTSRNRLIQMLSRCDQAYLDALECNKLENFGNRIKVAQSIYRTFGLIQDEAQIKVQNIIPVQILVKGSDGTERVYRAGDTGNRISPQTGNGVREQE